MKTSKYSKEITHLINDGQDLLWAEKSYNNRKPDYAPQENFKKEELISMMDNLEKDHVEEKMYQIWDRATGEIYDVINVDEYAGGVDGGSEGYFGLRLVTVNKDLIEDNIAQDIKNELTRLYKTNSNLKLIILILIIVIVIMALY